jgi:hypothetical protein
MSLISTNSLTSEDTSKTLRSETKVNIPSGWFNIVGKTGLCVSARNNNGKLTQQTCGTGDDLLWTTERNKNGLIIRNKTGRVMDNYYNKQHNGNPVIGYSINFTAAQIWVIESVKNGDHVHFRNLFTNRCFDDTGKAGINHTYHIWDCSNGNKNQWFRLKKSNGIKIGRAFNIIHPNGKCISSYSSNVQRVYRNQCMNTRQQLWTFIPHNGAYVITNSLGFSIDNSSSTNKNGNSIIAYTQTKNGNQQWVPIRVDDKYFLLKNPQTGKCIEETLKQKNGFSLYKLWDCSITKKSQMFSQR